MSIKEAVEARIEKLNAELEALKVAVPREIALFEARMNERAGLLQREVEELQKLLVEEPTE